MSAEKIMRALLLADSGVTALVGSDIYPGVIPEGREPVRSLVVALLDNEPQPTIDGINQAPLMFRALVSVACVAKTYADVKALVGAVRTAAHLKRGSVAGAWLISSVLQSEGPDEYGIDQGVFLQAVDYTITYQ